MQPLENIIRDNAVKLPMNLALVDLKRLEVQKDFDVVAARLYFKCQRRITQARAIGATTVAATWLK